VIGLLSDFEVISINRDTVSKCDEAVSSILSQIH